MRAYELFETDFVAMGLYDPQQDDFGSRKLGDTRKPPLTLQHLHKLKHIRNSRRRELEKKLELVGLMYTDPDRQQQSAALDLEHERQEHALKMMKDEIALEIAAAKMGKDKKEHIRHMLWGGSLQTLNSSTSFTKPASLGNSGESRTGYIRS